MAQTIIEDLRKAADGIQAKPQAEYRMNNKTYSILVTGSGKQALEHIKVIIDNQLADGQIIQFTPAEPHKPDFTWLEPKYKEEVQTGRKRKATKKKYKYKKRRK